MLRVSVANPNPHSYPHPQVVTGPTQDDPYYGPCLEILDQAVEWAEKHEIQVLLDLHGNPGGESTEKPCGHANPKWEFSLWRREEALEVLRIVAERYCENECVTGIQVCNEPAWSIKPEDLVKHYIQAAKIIREVTVSHETKFQP